MPLQTPPPPPPPSDPAPLLLPEYPARTRETHGAVQGVPTVVSRTDFADKILVTVSQDGRLAQWIHVPLSSSSPTDTTDTDNTIAGASNTQDPLLPLPHLTPKTLLGATSGSGAREIVGHLYATQIASGILAREPGEGRSLLVGLGLGRGCFETGGDGGREGFYDMVELVMKVM